MGGLLLICTVNLLTLEESLLHHVSGIKGDFSESSGKISNKALEATLESGVSCWKGRSLPFLFWPARLRSHLSCARRDAPCCFLASFPPAPQCCQGGLLSFLPSSQQRDCFEPSQASQALEATSTLARQITLLLLVGERGRGQKGTPCLAQQSASTRSQLWAACLCPGPWTWDSSYPWVAPSPQLQLQVPCDGGTRAVPLVQIPRTGEARCHRWGAFWQQTSGDPERTSLKPACRQGWSLLGGSGETVLGPSPGFRWRLVVALFPWLVHVSLPLCLRLHRLSSVCAFLTPVRSLSLGVSAPTPG